MSAHKDKSDIEAREALAVEGLSKAYHDAAHPYPALDAIALRLVAGEHMALLGPSGCGKTTLLRLIAGFLRPDAGVIRLAGKQVASPQRMLSPEARRVGFVFQDYALFPHLSVLQNVLFGLGRAAGYRNTRQRRARAKEILELVGLTIFQERMPHQLSGGQQQRVALARALAPEPAIILLDEPFSNLDAALRAGTRSEVKAILRKTNTTALLVTHDQEEALTFADSLALMRAGKLEQVGIPEHVYQQPASAFVASFLGSTNLINGKGHPVGVETALGVLPLAEPPHLGSTVKVSLRPEALHLYPEHAAPTQGTRVTVLQRDFKGHDVTYRCADANGLHYLVQHAAQHDADLVCGQPAQLCVQGDAVVLRS